MTTNARIMTVIAGRMVILLPRTIPVKLAKIKNLATKMRPHVKTTWVAAKLGNLPDS